VTLNHDQLLIIEDPSVIVNTLLYFGKMSMQSCHNLPTSFSCCLVSFSSCFSRLLQTLGLDCRCRHIKVDLALFLEPCVTATEPLSMSLMFVKICAHSLLVSASLSLVYVQLRILHIL
jgi:hypothetical protein